MGGLDLGALAFGGMLSSTLCLKANGPDLPDASNLGASATTMKAQADQGSLARYM